MGLAVIAGALLVISYLASIFFQGLFIGVPFWRAFPLGFISIIFTLLALALGIYIAVTRVR
jgi:hypothetical protein